MQLLHCLDILCSQQNGDKLNTNAMVLLKDIYFNIDLLHVTYHHSCHEHRVKFDIFLKDVMLINAKLDFNEEATMQKRGESWTKFRLMRARRLNRNNTD